MNENIFEEPTITVMPLSDQVNAVTTSGNEDWGGGAEPFRLPKV